MKKILMELVGTFFFILTIVMTANPFAIASMLMAWVYIGGFISGAHFNPMVSLAMALCRKLSWNNFFYYSLAQIIGGFLAFALTVYLTGHFIVPRPNAATSLFQDFIVEMLLAFVLALEILVIATYEKYDGNFVTGFAIGFTIPALALLGTPISGGLFNPAISLGGALFSLIKGVQIIPAHLIMYVGGASVGGALAACFYKYFFMSVYNSYYERKTTIVEKF